MSFPNSQTDRTHLPTVVLALITRFELTDEDNWSATLQRQLIAAKSLLEDANPQHPLLADERLENAIERK